MQNYVLAIKLALSSIRANKIRALLNMLGIIIGVSSVISILSIGAGAESLITGSIQKIGTNMIGVLPGYSEENSAPAAAYGVVIKTLTQDDADDIGNLSYVDSICSYVQGNGEITYKSKTITGAYSGVSSGFMETENQKMASGRFFTQKEDDNYDKVMILGADMKDKLFPVSDPVGEKVRINNISFKVIGVLESKGAMLVQNPDDKVYIPIKTTQKLLIGEDHLSAIRFKVDKEENITLATQSTIKILRRNHNIDTKVDEDFTVRSLAQALDAFTTITDGIKLFLALIAAVSLLVGGIGITNIMLMTVKERTSEIGLRKAIGAKRSNINSQFIVETLVLTMFGGIIGIFAGVSFSYIVSLVVGSLGYDWIFTVPASSVILSVAISLLVGLLFGLYPARQAAKLDPINALRYE